MKLRDLAAWLFMASASFPVGIWTAVAQTPVLAATAGTPSDSGGYVQFGRLVNHGNGAVTFCYSDTSDDGTIDVIQQAHVRVQPSFDYGATFPSSKNYKARSLRSSNEPVISQSKSGAMSPHGFSSVANPYGRTVGGMYALAPLAGDLRTLTCPFTVMADGGMSLVSEGNCVIGTLPKDVAAVAGSTNYVATWFGNICTKGAFYYSVIEVIHAGEGSLFSCYCIRSSNLKTWTVIGTVADISNITGEGYSEASIALDNDGVTLVVISRDGTSTFGRSTSTDGVTWSSPTADKLAVGKVAPFPYRLSSGDWALVCGRTSIKHGIALGTSLKSSSFSDVLDLTTVHDTLITNPSDQFGGVRIPTAYGTIVTLSSNGVTDRILANYDMNPVGALMRGWVMEMTIART